MSRNDDAATYIAGKLVELRSLHGKTLWQVATAIGVSDTALRYWESAQRNIGAVELFLLAEYYGVSVDSFFVEVTPTRRAARPRAQPAPRIDTDPEVLALRMRIVARRERRQQEREARDGQA